MENIDEQRQYLRAPVNEQVDVQPSSISPRSSSVPDVSPLMPSANDDQSISVSKMDYTTVITSGSMSIAGLCSPSDMNQLKAMSNVNVADMDADDARSTSSSHPFSSPNPSEHDDVHGAIDAAGSHSDPRKIYRRKRQHNEFVNACPVGHGNPLFLPLSERQQLALAMQLSAQNQAGDPKSPSGMVSASSSVCGGRQKKVAKVHRRNERGETPLHLAAKRGEYSHCRELIDEGADVNCVDYAGWTPLHEACNQSWYNTAKVLLEHGASVNVCGLDDDTPLHDAALTGHLKLVLLLLHHGADPFKPNKKGKRPVDVAEDPEVIRVMLEGTKSFSPSSNYSADNQVDEEPEHLKQDLDKTLSARDAEFDTSTAGTSVFEISDSTSISTVKVTDTDDKIMPMMFQHLIIDNLEENIPATTKEANLVRETENLIHPESTSMDTSVLDVSTNIAYASTESESEQRLVVVEDDSYISEPSTFSAQPAKPMEQAEGTSTTVSDTVKLPTATTSKSYLDQRLARPKRPMSYMRQRRLERGSIITPHGAPLTVGATRGRKRKVTGGVGTTDVYEFHSSDSDFDSEPTDTAGQKPRSKFPLIGLRTKNLKDERITSFNSTKLTVGANELAASGLPRISKLELETKPIVEKPKVEADEVQDTKAANLFSDGPNCVEAALSSAKGMVERSVQNEVIGMEATQMTLETQESIDVSQSKMDAGSKIESYDISPSSSQSALTTDIALKPSFEFGFSSRKERLLNFGKRRGLNGGVKNQKERDDHIDNIVASIGSGVASEPNLSALDVDQKKKSVDLTVDDFKPDLSTVVAEQLQSPPEPQPPELQPPQPKIRGQIAVVENVIVNDEEVSSGLLKVPPLKLILAGRSTSEDEVNGNFIASREASARTYIVSSRANSPASERRGSSAAEFADFTSAPTSSREDTRRTGSSNVPNNGGGNGGSEASQRVTRSQVRLHGAQLDRTVEDTTIVHPRKRKLRSSKTIIEPVVTTRPLLPTVSASLAAIAVKNSYESHQHMKKAIANKWKQEMANNSIAMTPIKGYDRFLLKTKSYLHQDKDKSNDPENKPVQAVDNIPRDLAELRKRQSDERSTMQKRHQIERERLIMSCESEAIREHNRTVRGTPDPAMSVMRILRDADLYNPLQLDRDIPFSLAASTGQTFPMTRNDAEARFAKSKKQLIGRQRLEAQCLYASQVQEWETKLKLLMLRTTTDPVHSVTVNVPQISIMDEFTLLPLST